MPVRIDPNLFAVGLLSPQLLRGAHHVGRHRFFYRCQFSQSFAKHAAATDFLLRRIGFIQLKTRRPGQLASGLLNNDAEFLAQRPRVSLGQFHGGANAHCFKVHGHSTPYSPHLGHGCIAQHPVALEVPAKVHDPAGMSLQSLRRVVGQLGQGFGMSDPYTDRDAGILKYAAAYFPAYGRGISYAGQVSE